MPDLKELLSELQATDTHLQKMLTEQEAIPAEIKKLEDAIAELDRRFEETKTALTEARKDLKLAELNLTTQEELVARYNSQLYSAKTNEEYKAFLKEIETAERKKTEAEDRIIELMERIEREETELKKMEEEKGSQQVSFTEDIQKVKAYQAELDEKIKLAQEKYDRLRNELPEDALDLYDRIKNGKQGLAVATMLEGNRCSGCLNPVPDQRAIEAGHSEHLVFCEYCGRILIP